jgi:hypothetical protein
VVVRGEDDERTTIADAALERPDETRRLLVELRDLAAS